RSSLRSIRKTSCRDDPRGGARESRLVMVAVLAFARQGAWILARAGALIGIVTLIAAGAALPSASAVLHLDVTGGTIQPIPIAIPNFLAGGPDAALGAEIAGVIT